MGNSLEQWRAAVGCFSQPATCKSALKSLKLKYSTYMSLSIRLLLFILLTVEGIESNQGPYPAPGSFDPGARGSRRLENRGGARGSGPPRGRGSGLVDHFADYQPSSQDTRSLRRSQRIQERPPGPALSHTLSKNHPRRGEKAKRTLIPLTLILRILITRVILQIFS